MTDDDEAWALTDWVTGCGFYCFLCRSDHGEWPWIESETAEAAARAHVCHDGAGD